MDYLYSMAEIHRLLIFHLLNDLFVVRIGKSVNDVSMAIAYLLSRFIVCSVRLEAQEEDRRLETLFIVIKLHAHTGDSTHYEACYHQRDQCLNEESPISKAAYDYE